MSARMARGMVRWWSLLLVAVALACACSPGDDDGGDDATCVPYDAACAPLYQPTFDQVFQRTLKPTCALSGRSCHAAEGRQGFLVYEEPDEAYDLLLQSGAVKPGDASCSKLAYRIGTDRASRRMPPGAPLSEAERCAIQKWIADGAKR